MSRIGVAVCGWAVFMWTPTMAVGQLMPSGTDASSLQVALQCERDFEYALERHACVAQRAERGSPQQMVAEGWHLLQGAQPGRPEEALALFEAAARQHYPPAYEGLAVGYSHRNTAISAAWRDRAARSGLAEEARNALRRTGPSPPDAASFHLIHCHPASLKERRLIRRDDPDSVLQQAQADGLAALRARGRGPAQAAKEHFREHCRGDDSYYLQGLSPEERAMARARAAEAIRRVQQMRQQFPELEIQAWPEAEDLPF